MCDRVDEGHNSVLGLPFGRIHFSFLCCSRRKKGLQKSDWSATYNSECLAILTASTSVLPHLLFVPQLLIQELAPIGVNDGLVF